MKTYEYRTDWIKDDIITGSNPTEPIPVPNTTAYLNTHATEGWEPITITPGNNTATDSGLFITLRRQSN